MPFIAPYTTNPPVASPETIGASASNLPDGDQDHAPYVLLMESLDGIDVEVKLSAGAATYRPYYWVPVKGIANGGSWIPVGGDAASGSGPVSAAAATHGGGANGRYQHRGGKKWWILVRESSAGETVTWAKLEARRVVLE